MLSNLASYLLGYNDGRQEAEPREADTAPTQRLISETEEDDWVVVSQPGEEGEGEGGMEESWFVTPPPCFASTGPVSVETSPLENLLIEHPSMSVYRRGGSLPTIAATTSMRSPARRRATPTSTTPPRDENTRPRSGSTQRPAVSPTAAAAPVPQPQPRHRHPLHHLVAHQQVQQIHIAQKQQIRRNSELLNKSHLEKDNKVREVNGRNKRQRRSDRQKKHSGANNNRKC